MNSKTNLDLDDHHYDYNRERQQPDTDDNTSLQRTNENDNIFSDNSDEEGGDGKNDDEEKGDGREDDDEGDGREDDGEGDGRDIGKDFSSSSLTPLEVSEVENSENEETSAFHFADLIASCNELSDCLHAGTPQWDDNQTIRKALIEINKVLYKNNEPGLSDGACRALLSNDFKFLPRILLPLWIGAAENRAYENLTHLAFIFNKVLSAMITLEEDTVVLKESKGDLGDAVRHQGQRIKVHRYLKDLKENFASEAFWKGIEIFHRHLQEWDLLNCCPVEENRKKCDIEAEIHRLEMGDDTIEKRIPKLIQTRQQLKEWQTQQKKRERSHDSKKSILTDLILGILRCPLNRITKNIEGIKYKPIDLYNQDAQIKIAKWILHYDLWRIIENDWRNIISEETWQRKSRRMNRMSRFGNPLKDDTSTMWMILNFYFYLLHSLDPIAVGYHIASVVVEDLKDPNGIIRKSTISVDVIDPNENVNEFDDIIWSARNEEMFRRIRSRMAPITADQSKVTKQRRQFESCFGDLFGKHGTFHTFDHMRCFLYADCVTDSSRAHAERLASVLTEDILLKLSRHIMSFLVSASNKLFEGWLADCAANDDCVKTWGLCKLIEFMTWMLIAARTASERLEDMRKRVISLNHEQEGSLLNRCIFKLIQINRSSLETNSILLGARTLLRNAKLSAAQANKFQLRSALNLTYEHQKWAEFLIQSEDTTVLKMIGRAVVDELSKAGLTIGLGLLLRNYTPRRYDKGILMLTIQNWDILLTSMKSLGNFLVITRSKRLIGVQGVVRRNAHREVHESATGLREEEDERSKSEKSVPLRRLTTESLLKELRDGRVALSLMYLLRNRLHQPTKFNERIVSLLECIGELSAPSSVLSPWTIMCIDAGAMDIAVDILSRDDPMGDVTVKDFFRRLISKFWEFHNLNRFILIESLFAKGVARKDCVVTDRWILLSVASGYQKGRDTHTRIVEGTLHGASISKEDDKSDINWKLLEDAVLCHIYTKHHITDSSDVIIRNIRRVLPNRSKKEIVSRMDDTFKLLVGEDISGSQYLTELEVTLASIEKSESHIFAELIMSLSISADGKNYLKECIQESLDMLQGLSVGNLTDRVVIRELILLLMIKVREQSASVVTEWGRKFVTIFEDMIGQRLVNLQKFISDVQTWTAQSRLSQPKDGGSEENTPAVTQNQTDKPLFTPCGDVCMDMRFGMNDMNEGLIISIFVLMSLIIGIKWENKTRRMILPWQRHLFEFEQSVNEINGLLNRDLDNLKSQHATNVGDQTKTTLIEDLSLLPFKELTDIVETKELLMCARHVLTLRKKAQSSFILERSVHYLDRFMDYLLLWIWKVHTARKEKSVFNDLNVTHVEDSDENIYDDPEVVSHLLGLHDKVSVTVNDHVQYFGDFPDACYDRCKDLNFTSPTGLGPYKDMAEYQRCLIDLQGLPDQMPGPYKWTWDSKASISRVLTIWRCYKIFLYSEIPRLEQFVTEVDENLEANPSFKDVFDLGRLSDEIFEPEDGEGYKGDREDYGDGDQYKGDGDKYGESVREKESGSVNRASPEKTRDARRVLDALDPKKRRHEIRPEKGQKKQTPTDVKETPSDKRETPIDLEMRNDREKDAVIDERETWENGATLGTAVISEKTAKTSDETAKVTATSLKETGNILKETGNILKETGNISRGPAIGLEVMDSSKNVTSTERLNFETSVYLPESVEELVNEFVMQETSDDLLLQKDDGVSTKRISDWAVKQYASTWLFTDDET